MQRLHETCRALGLALSVIAAISEPAGAQPVFELDFSCPECPPDLRLEGIPGERKDFEVAATLAAAGLSAGDPGARGWSVSVGCEGGWFYSARVSALGDLPDTAGVLALEGGFEKTEFTHEAEPGSECESLHGVVSTVVLSLSDPVTLDPAIAHPILNLGVSAEVPFGRSAGRDGCVSLRLSYADGCLGSDGAVANEVKYAGAPVIPSRGEQEFFICRKADCSDARLNVMVQREAIEESGIPFAGMLTGDIDETAEVEFATPAGRPGRLPFYAAIVSQGLETGVQGWSFSISVQGDLEAVDTTIAGTSSEVAMEGGFQVCEVIDPGKPCSGGGQQGEGFVAAAVLSFTEPLTLLPTGTATVLELTVGTQGTQGDVPIEGLVQWVDGLTGAG